ncbi:pH-response regulator protein palA/rim20 [Malassezia vespertilionis]|nr:pH-response regulator protein palA/rim20 [Malassezia vespertilionis]WFD05807.1 pH-response regulator protein palA/rim20 [Malassezia vespertilionis]
MSNVLGIAVPRSEAVPLREGLLAYIAERFPDMDAALFHADIDAWTIARNACVSLSVHVDSIHFLMQYWAQLSFLASLVDDDVHVLFPWASGMHAYSLKPHRSVSVERALIIFSIAAQYSQLGKAEPRMEKESMKHAISFFQLAAGCLGHLLTFPLQEAASDLVELEHASLHALKHLMLAQAQECFWQKAVQDGMKDATIAKLARSVADLYECAAADASRSRLPLPWAQHMQYKQWHFRAAAQFRKSNDDLANRRYGDELGRLTLASDYVRRAMQIPTRNLECDALANDLQSLQSIVKENLARAERDNELIYLDTMTSEAGLLDVGTAVMVQATVPEALQAPVAWLRKMFPDQQLWLQRLVMYGMDVVLRLYNDQKSQFIAKELKFRVAERQQASRAKLAALGLPDALDRIESPRCMPRGWAQYTQVLRRAGGVHALQDGTDEVQRCALRAKEVLHAMQGPLFKAYPGLADAHVQQQHALQAQWREYEAILAQADASDAVVREKLDSVAPWLSALQQGETALLAMLEPYVVPLERCRRDLVSQLRALRAEMETLDDEAAQCSRLVQEAENTDDTPAMRKRLIAAAKDRHLGDWSVDVPEAVDPSKLQDVVQDGLATYTVYLHRLDELCAAHKRQLHAVEAAWKQICAHAQLRGALASQQKCEEGVEHAYAAYMELDGNIQEGRDFYERLLPLLTSLHTEQQDWQRHAPTKASPKWGAFHGGNICFDA